ncbi:MAG: hypothetical protein QOE36_818 [Gaiellaceae bacterium]|jgi:hypothetical protein|nr:hypothetical protein [Gaiellaceae bacterium]
MAAVAAALVLAGAPGLGLGRVLEPLGLYEDWTVFAPNPVHQHFVFEAVVEDAGGATHVWTVPRRSALTAAAGNRWELWANRVVRDDSSRLWRPAAQWVAHQERLAGHRPVRITLRRLYAELPPPGHASAALRWQGFDFYTLELG